MDLKGIVDKAKSALKSNPDLIEKGGDAVDKATGNKFASQVDKAQDAARKAVGADEKRADEKRADENKPGENRPEGK
ncbi:antitoxin [Gordonia sp. HY285]|uniref:antitoxin n=1 Tax=Gordonia liuliyuniae TaxID=2911517 RepID=UPI001F221A3F|nr:antitoxin [Gordonia liuliyuniae]MCF8609739.1 antitoxin [Gordonia liuliyuniae]